MCCLKYEQSVYEELLRTTPKAGTLVSSPEGRGLITDVSLLTGMLKVRLDNGEGFKSIHKSEVSVLAQVPSMQPKRDEPGKNAKKTVQAVKPPEVKIE